MWSKSHHNELIKSNGFKVQLTRLSLYMVNFIRPSDWSAEKKKFTAVPVFSTFVRNYYYRTWQCIFCTFSQCVNTINCPLHTVHINRIWILLVRRSETVSPIKIALTLIGVKVTESKTVQMTIRQIQIWQTLYTLIYMSVYVYKALKRIKNTRHFLKCQILCIDTQPLNWIFM